MNEIKKAHQEMDSFAATPKQVAGTDKSVREANQLIDQFIDKYMDAMKYLEEK
ncbi:hypothetical protein [Lacticaseibacillus jixiensis]|uniref:hypothetical protein n=1 Tax=Lacticaseibacillus jixiensis TaxID=3231926 RepID=UPI0036F446E6